MKILPVIDTERIGGPGKGLLALVKHIRKDCEVPGVVIFHREGRAESDFSKALKKENIRPFTIKERYPFDFSTICNLFNIIKQQKPNIIQTHGYKASFYLMLLDKFIKHKSKSKWVAWLHGTTAENTKIKIFQTIEKYAVFRAQIIICVSRALSDKINQTKTKCVVVPNGIEEDYNQLITPDLNLLRKNLNIGKRKIILVVGRYSFEKGQDRIPEIALALSKIRNDFVFLLIGEGSTKETIIKSAKKLGVINYLILHQYTSDIRPFYLAADIVMMSSRSEGMPNVVLEALYMKAPMISFDIGGVKEIYTDKQEGLIVPDGDITSMIDTINYALNNSDVTHKLAAAGYDKIVKYHLNASRAEHVMQVYKQI